MGGRQGGASRTGTYEGAYLNRYVTEEQRSRRPIFIATFGLRVFWPAALSLIGQRPQRVFSLFASRIQPKYAAAPLHQSLTWYTRYQFKPRFQGVITNACLPDPKLLCYRDSVHLVSQVISKTFCQ